MKLMRTVFCLLMMSMVCAGCVREDLDDCPVVGHVVLSYLGDGTEEIFPEKINRVHMYIFDEENLCISSALLTDREVEQRTAQLPPLPTGRYRIVCLGNTHHTQSVGTETQDYRRMLFSSDDWLAGRTVHTDDSLYYASIPYEVQPYDQFGTNEQTVLIPFASSHYDLLVEVIGVPESIDTKATRAGYAPQIDITNVAPETDFENQVTDRRTDYILKGGHDTEKMVLTAKANIMRHQDHENVNVHFRLAPEAEPLATVNLAEFLRANPIIDCSKHEVLIPIRIEFKSGQVTVSVPEWFVQNVTPDFGK